MELIVTMVSFCGLIPGLFISGTFIPCIPQISKDIKSTSAIVSMAVSVSILSASLGAMTASSYSTYYGRRPVYLTFLPLLFAGSLGVASAQSVTQLMTWRAEQAFGASPAPFIGGLSAHYASWRLPQLVMGLSGLFVFVLVYAFLPETSHPGERGVDKVKSLSDEGAAALRSERPLRRFTKTLPIFINPLRPLALMRNPNLLFVCLAGFFVLQTGYTLLVPIAYTIGERYGISNEAIIGACILPSGLGTTTWRHLVPEDRLRAALPSALFAVPTFIWASGFITSFVKDNRVGLSLNVLCIFLNGMAIDFVFTPSGSYIVDTMHSRSAESMAANTALRSVIMSIGVLSLIGFGFLWITVRYGEKLGTWGTPTSDGSVQEVG
ncbi:hypothetical protein D9611_010546 [Ephemerocybe angulata]|uniref:MFS general substrate transporter n=1 Tax=Ephemerocybe angulata TaxID=980116 RepID=A0A8H5BV32_9AGAR|nr:hypothetical protein D9611_010546 [Tulosesus angulatus]